MNKKFDTTYTQCDQATFARVDELFRVHRGAQVVSKLEELFESGVPANGYLPSIKGMEHTYLRYALAVGNVDAAEYLIRLNYKDMEQAGCSFDMCLNIPSAVKALLEAGHTFEREILDELGGFWLSVHWTGPDFYRTLVERGVDLDLPALRWNIKTPPVVEVAIKHMDTRVLQNLLQAGAAPDSRQDGGYSALHGAVTQGSDVRAKKLDSEHNVVRMRNVVDLVLAAGGDINMVDDEGLSALHLACQLGYFNKAKVLLDAGANLELKDKNGKTPEALAKGAKRKDVENIFAATRARSAILDVVAKAAGAAKTASNP